MFALNPETQRRLYRWVLLGIPKKNGKTELLAWLGLYFLLGDDEPTPWIACAASSDNQADLVFGAAKRCAEWSPTLSQVTETWDREILVPSSPGAKLVRVTSGTGTNDGPSWHVILCDEFHEWSGLKGKGLWEVLTNGIGGREQPMIVQATTAGFDVDGTICGEQYLFGQRLADDPSLDPRYLFWWYEPPEEDADYTDPALWEEVNPSWGVTLPDPFVYLEDQLTKKSESTFRRYFLNQWVLSEDIWIPHGAWKNCDDRSFFFDPDLPLYVGVDGALKRDTFAIVGGQRQDDLFVTKARIWENPFPPGHRNRTKWKLNLEDPLGFLRDLAHDFPVSAVTEEDGTVLPGPAFGYDPRYLEYAAQRLEGDGLTMIEFPQTDARMCPASELTYELIMTKKFRHDGNTDYRRQVHAAVPKNKDRGWRITRPAGTHKPIDAATAAVMAASLAYKPGEPEEDQRAPTIW